MATRPKVTTLTDSAAEFGNKFRVLSNAPEVFVEMLSRGMPFLNAIAVENSMNSYPVFLPYASYKGEFASSVNSNDYKGIARTLMSSQVEASVAISTVEYSAHCRAIPLFAFFVFDPGGHDRDMCGSCLQVGFALCFECASCGIGVTLSVCSTPCVGIWCCHRVIGSLAHDSSRIFIFDPGIAYIGICYSFAALDVILLN